MGLKRKAPQIEASVMTTHWAGDDAVDLEASDIEQWCATGDPQYLVPIKGMELAVIRFKPLNEVQASQLPPMADYSPQIVSGRLYEAFRLGVLSIDGEKLNFTRPNGVRLLTEHCQEKLLEVREKIPFRLLMNAIIRESGVPFEDDEDSKVLIESNLPLWLGGVILLNTFRCL